MASRDDASVDNTSLPSVTTTIQVPALAPTDTTMTTTATATATGITVTTTISRGSNGVNNDDLEGPGTVSSGSQSGYRVQNNSGGVVAPAPPVAAPAPAAGSISNQSTMDTGGRTTGTSKAKANTSLSGGSYHFTAPD
ncbi:hypothetical protein NW768_004830 [Fusarium equiseti]|uniref:Uncharacterized protein n=1 Tax=Fusarium equiseti TaxID=61235 RepID=A0ABQ8RHC3_FUSEQ|nr:hypothetical protein NW768_004830 [Fusarium equiseti]